MAFFRNNWKKAYLIMILTLLIDLDHLLAVPIYDPLRCSINFHPLHSFYAIFIYFSLCFIPKTKYAGIGLMIHVVLDSLNCKFTNDVWFV